MMMFYGPWFGWGLGYPFMYIAMLAWWIMPIAAVYLLIRLFTRQDAKPYSSDTALDIARARFARGEIDIEEFRKLKEDLS